LTYVETLLFRRALQLIWLRAGITKVL